MTVTPSSILVPSGLAKVHPQLETCIKSIKSAVSALNGSVTASSSQTNHTATLANQLQALQAEVAALGAVGAVNPQPAYRAGAAISAYTAIYAISSGIAGIASSAAAASSTAIIGIATATAASGSIVSYAGPGETITNPAWSFSAGPVFLGSAGALTQTVPTGSFPVQIGSAISATVVLVDIQGSFVPLLNASGDPSAVALYVNSTDGTLRYYNGSAWVHLGALSGISCAYATASALPTNTYSNGTAGVGATLTATADGALSVDSAEVAAGQHILVKNEVASANNGIYLVTQTGSASTRYILTRASDANEANQLGPGIIVPVKAPSGSTAGTVNDGLPFLSAAPLPFVVGTSSITFAAIGGSYTAGTGLSLTGTAFAITNTAVAPGTYGGSTQVGQFTVNAQGQITSASNVAISGGGGGGFLGIVGQYILLLDQPSSGTTGGSATASAWNTRRLQTIANDDTGLVTLSSNQFTLPAGTYRVSATAPAVETYNHRIRLENVTAGTYIYGVSEWNDDALTTAQTNAKLVGVFTISATATFQLQHYVVSANAGTQTLGVEIGISGVNELYSIIELVRVSATGTTTKTIVVPTTGFSNTISSATTPFINYILNPAGTLPTGTITLPATPIDGQMVILGSDQTITALTLSANAGQSIKSGITTLSAGPLGTVRYIYDLASTTWYPA